MRRRPFPDLPPGARLKRDPALVPLSQDHHHALVQSLRLRDAAAGEPGPAAAAARAFLDHWHGAMLGHFADEEEVARLEESPGAGPVPRDLLAELGWFVHDHVRFEERVLFEDVQTGLGPSGLADVGRALEAHPAARGLAPACPTGSG